MYITLFYLFYYLKVIMLNVKKLLKKLMIFMFLQIRALNSPNMNESNPMAYLRRGPGVQDPKLSIMIPISV